MDSPYYSKLELVEVWWGSLSRGGWSVIRSASLAKRGTLIKRLSLHFRKVPTRTNKVSPRTFQIKEHWRDLQLFDSVYGGSGTWYQSGPLHSLWKHDGVGKTTSLFQQSFVKLLKSTCIRATIRKEVISSAWPERPLLSIFCRNREDASAFCNSHVLLQCLLLLSNLSRFDPAIVRAIREEKLPTCPPYLHLYLYLLLPPPSFSLWPTPTVFPGLYCIVHAGFPMFSAF